LSRHQTTLLASLALVAAAAVGVRDASAEPVFGALAGYARGTLDRGAEERFAGPVFQVYGGYQYWKLNTHLFVQSMDLDYEYAGDRYQGVYATTGLGVSYLKQGVSFNRPHKLTFAAQLPLTTAFTVLSESSGTINDNDYINSSLSTLQGGQGAQVLGGIEWTAVGRGGAKTGENFSWGFYLSYLTHTFAKESTRIKTNNSDLAPPSPGTIPARAKVATTGFLFGFSYDL
jgi:hypothetical protein